MSCTRLYLEFEEKISKLEEANGKLKRSLAKSESDIKHIRDCNDKTVATNKRLRVKCDEVERLKDSDSVLRKENNALRDENSIIRLVGENERLNAEIHELKESLANRDRTIKRIRDHNVRVKCTEYERLKNDCVSF